MRPDAGICCSTMRRIAVRDWPRASRDRTSRQLLRPVFPGVSILYDRRSCRMERAAADFYKVFSVHDAQLYDERFNLLNAFLAAVPETTLQPSLSLSAEYQLRGPFLSFHTAFRRNPNAHLRQEYLAVLETSHGTPYFLNLHYCDTAHSMILGGAAAGKVFLLIFSQPICRNTIRIPSSFDVGGSFRKSHVFSAVSYLRLGLESADSPFNPSVFRPTSRTSTFSRSFLKFSSAASSANSILRWIASCTTG